MKTKTLILIALVCALPAFAGTRYIPTPQGWYTIRTQNGVITSVVTPDNHYLNGPFFLPFIEEDCDE